MRVALTGDTREQKPQFPGVQTLQSSPDCQAGRHRPRDLLTSHATCKCVGGVPQTTFSSDNSLEGRTDRTH